MTPRGGMPVEEAAAARNLLLLDEALRLIERARREGIEARLIGGLGDPASRLRAARPRRLATHQ